MKVLDIFKDNIKVPVQFKWIKGEFRYEIVSENGEDLSSVSTNPGVYAFVENDKILKIGKADGKKGLCQRLNNYIGKGKTRGADKTAQLIARVMENSEFDGTLIDIYYIPTEVESYTDKYGKTRYQSSFNVTAYERDLSKDARNQGEPMSLSRT